MWAHVPLSLRDALHTAGGIRHRNGIQVKEACWIIDE
jgi:hypothetical protein